MRGEWLGTWGNEGDEEEGQSWANLTLEMLSTTPEGVTFPTTVTFFVAISMVYDVTPSILEICFLTFPSHPLQWIDTLKTTTWSSSVDGEGDEPLVTEDEEDEEVDDEEIVTLRSRKGIKSLERSDDDNQRSLSSSL